MPIPRLPPAGRLGRILGISRLSVRRAASIPGGGADRAAASGSCVAPRLLPRPPGRTFPGRLPRVSPGTCPTPAQVRAGSLSAIGHLQSSSRNKAGTKQELAGMLNSPWNLPQISRGPSCTAPASRGRRLPTRAPSRDSCLLLPVSRPTPALRHHTLDFSSAVQRPTTACDGR